MHLLGTLVMGINIISYLLVLLEFKCVTDLLLRINLSDYYNEVNEVLMHKRKPAFTLEGCIQSFQKCKGLPTSIFERIWVQPISIGGGGGGGGGGGQRFSLQTLG